MDRVGCLSGDDPYLRSATKYGDPNPRIAATISAKGVTVTMSVDDAYNRGDYATALRLARQLADRGDAAAQYNLGVMYAKGHGVSQNYAEALKWFHLAADQEYASAQYRAGCGNLHRPISEVSA